MNKNKIRCCLSAILVLHIGVFSAGAILHAANHDDERLHFQSVGKGLYYRLGYSVGIFDKKLCNDYFDSVRGTFNSFKATCQRKLVGVTIDSGYKFNKYFALDGEYIRIGDGGFVVEGTSSVTGRRISGSASVAHSSIAYGIQVAYPIDAFQLSWVELE